MTLSSAESETYSAVEATKDILYFRAVLAGLGLAQLQPTPLYVDNKSLITLAYEFSGKHKRCKHFLARIHFMIEQVENQVVHLIHLGGEDLPADTLTKPLARPAFEKHCDSLLGKLKQE